MPDLFEFLLLVVVVTSSGALAPGPLTVCAIQQGFKGGARVGLSMALGHMLVEFPLVILLALGLLSIGLTTNISPWLGIAGGAAIVVLGSMQIKDAYFLKANDTWSNKSDVRRPLILGLLFTALNPFFIAWWVIIGAPLIVQATVYAAIGGVLLMYIAHVWLDYAWLSVIAGLSRRGSRIVGSTGHRILLGALGVVLIYFGYNLLSNSQIFVS